MSKFAPINVWVKGCFKTISSKKEWKKYLRDKKSGDGYMTSYVPETKKSVSRGTTFHDAGPQLSIFDRRGGTFNNSDNKKHSYLDYYYKFAEPKPIYEPVPYQKSGKKPKLLTENQINKLKEICQRPIESFGQKNWKTVKTANGLNYYYLDRGSKILAVAHLDSVCQEKKFIYEVNDKKEEIVWCPQLDDRLGAWVILEHLFDQLNYDILLCDGEESGRSTARYFTEKPKGYYNWIFEFDRKGTDVVLYKYEDKDFRKKLESVGFKIGWGSFSDISCLEDLGCKAMNIGVGYHDYHSEDANANILDTLTMIKKFKKFYKQFSNKHLPHEKSVAPVYTYKYGTYKKILDEIDKENKLSDDEWWRMYGGSF